METKHTIAPWGCIAHSPRHQWFTIDSTQGYIARAFYGDAQPPVSEETALFNATLIHAAPELLNVCVSLLELKDLILPPAPLDAVSEEYLHKFGVLDAYLHKFQALTQLIREAQHARDKALIPPTL